MTAPRSLALPAPEGPAGSGPAEPGPPSLGLLAWVRAPAAGNGEGSASGLAPALLGAKRLS
jgi:hypothetical protein